jgi:hypothetical protein
MSSPDTNNSLFARNIVRKVFFEDLPLKLTALGITLGLWLMVTGLSSPTTKRLTVPLNLSISSNADHQCHARRGRYRDQRR